jgi:hypothetical protein
MLLDRVAGHVYSPRCELFAIDAERCSVLVVTQHQHAGCLSVACHWPERFRLLHDVGSAKMCVASLLQRHAALSGLLLCAGLRGNHLHLQCPEFG